MSLWPVSYTHLDVYKRQGFINHCDIRIGSGKAGMYDVGNELEDVRFYGGEYGLSLIHIQALLVNIYTMIPMEDFNYRPNAGFNQRGYDGVNETTNLAFLTAKLPVVTEAWIQVMKDSIIGPMEIFVK